MNFLPSILIVEETFILLLIYLYIKSSSRLMLNTKGSRVKTCKKLFLHVIKCLDIVLWVAFVTNEGVLAICDIFDGSIDNTNSFEIFIVADVETLLVISTFFKAISGKILELWNFYFLKQISKSFLCLFVHFANIIRQIKSIF